jgi:hypothetical protein
LWARDTGEFFAAAPNIFAVNLSRARRYREVLGKKGFNISSDIGPLTFKEDCCAQQKVT